jgi:hypothetical protein
MAETDHPGSGERGTCAGRFTLKLTVNFNHFLKIHVNLKDFLQIRGAGGRLRPWNPRLHGILGTNVKRSRQHHIGY